MNNPHNSDSFNLNDLSPEQQKMLIEIRRRKTELLLEIQFLKTMNNPHNSDSFNLNDLSPEQQKMLIEIRRRKTELLLEIQ
ncbi:hypothetical protein LSTR_LSTR012925, partial [Laodelphax striatellus]